MSAVAEIIQELRQRGIELRADGTDLVARPANKLSDADVALLRTHKAAILASLAVPPNDALSNRLRAELVLWGGPLGWPSLVEIGIGEGARSWTEWLTVASSGDLQEAAKVARGVVDRLELAIDKALALASWGHRHGYPAIGPLGAGEDAWVGYCERASEAELLAAIRAVAAWVAGKAA